MQWIKAHKNIIIAGSITVIVLVAAFFLGGTKPSGSTDNETAATEATQENKTTISNSDASKTSEEGRPEGNDAESRNQIETGSATTTATKKETTVSDDTPVTETTTTAESASATETTTATESTAEAVNTQAVTFQCTLTISCAEILSHMDSLKPEKAGLVPSDGTILSTTVTVTEGETVYDVLRRTCTNSGIPLDASSGYVRGIQNLYERDCGTYSGWMYCVNGVYPNYGAASYVLKEGDSIQWNYSCSE